MDMNKEDAIVAFCKLANRVVWQKFYHKIPADCFCGFAVRHSPSFYHFDSRVLDYIKEAVYRQLELDRIRI